MICVIIIFMQLLFPLCRRVFVFGCVMLCMRDGAVLLCLLDMDMFIYLLPHRDTAPVVDHNRVRL